jgi:hypothetical protein
MHAVDHLAHASLRSVQVIEAGFQLRGGHARILAARPGTRAGRRIQFGSSVSQRCRGVRVGQSRRQLSSPGSPTGKETRSSSATAIAARDQAGAAKFSCRRFPLRSIMTQEHSRSVGLEVIRFRMQTRLVSAPGIRRMASAFISPYRSSRGSRYLPNNYTSANHIEKYS